MEVETWRKKATLPLIEGEVDEAVAAKKFGKYFYDICAPTSPARAAELLEEYNVQRSDYLIHDSVSPYLLMVEVVDQSIAALSLGKSAGIDGIVTEHLRHAHPVTPLILTKLFNLLILFGYVPDSFGMGIIVPILKPNKAATQVGSYRGITLTPVFSKVFEQCLLKVLAPFFTTSPMQFGFKRKTGCAKSIYTVRRVVEYFTKKGSTVNLCALDVEKAFDRLNMHALFMKLMKRRCPLFFISIIECWYSKSFGIVRWGGAYSEKFTLRAGTRQGGVLSPALFSVCIDDLLCKLNSSGFGCCVLQQFFAACMFADDILLLTISLSDLQQLLYICYDELNLIGMSINAAKSSYVRVGDRWAAPVAEVKLGRVGIALADILTYLGVVIERAAHFQCDFHAKKVKFFRCLGLQAVKEKIELFIVRLQCCI